MLFYQVSGNFGVTRNVDGVATREVRTIRPPKPNNSLFRKTFLFLCAKFINSMPTHLKNCNLKYLIKVRMRDWLLTLPEDLVDSIFTVVV